MLCMGAMLCMGVVLCMDVVLSCCACLGCTMSVILLRQVLVAEPSVADTISILRGLKEKYEGHHGVHITDRALVVAAELSDRYIQVKSRRLSFE
jgi:AAA lid domain